MKDLRGTDLTRLFHALGDLLQAEEARVGIVLVGGAALMLQGFVARTTTDVDVIAAARAPGRRGTGVRPPDRLPATFTRAVRRVARDFALGEDWINTVVAAQWKTGLPRGFAGRITWRRYGGLWVGLAGRRDLIYLKLYAAADDIGPGSRHYRDLLALAPTPEELGSAARWTRRQDPSPGFATSLAKVLEHVTRDTR